ncbi:MAG TPA: protein kinase, partial [Ktedonosporobacter sp.]|nr:protein kinase [Ktedonosporobacter sp.]
LQFAHAQGIIHQRLKPENILFGADDEILLSDFGFAWRFDAPQSMTSDPPVSEVAYLAPEQLMGQPQETSDQYALGAIVYEWLSGAPLFGGSAAEIARQQREMPPPPLRDRVADLSPLVEEVVMIALAKDPARRFRMIRGFATALEQAARDQATEGS